MCNNVILHRKQLVLHICNGPLMLLINIATSDLVLHVCMGASTISALFGEDELVVSFRGLGALMLHNPCAPMIFLAKTIDAPLF